MSSSSSKEDQRPDIQRVKITINGERRPRRQQSIRRLKYMRNGQLRSEDVPNCPSLQTLFTELNKMREERRDASADSLDEEDMNIDPYEMVADSIDTSTARKISLKHSDAQQQQQQSSQDEDVFFECSDSNTSHIAYQQQQPLQYGELYYDQNDSNTSYLSAFITSTAKFQLNQLGPLRSQSEIIRQDLEITLVGSRGKEYPIRRCRSYPDIHTSMWSMETALDERTLNLTLTNSCSMIQNYRGDDWDCFFPIWEFIVKLVMTLTRSSSSIIDNKWFLYMLMFVLGYFCLGMLHSLFVSTMANVTGMIWPLMHFFLASTAGFAWRMADWFSWMDEFGRSMVCDMAASYCRRYKLLCDQQCSFMDRAMERSHVGGHFCH